MAGSKGFRIHVDYDRPQPRIVVSIAGNDSLGGIEARREVNARLDTEDLRVALWNAAAACVDQMLALHAAYTTTTAGSDRRPFSKIGGGAS